MKIYKATYPNCGFYFNAHGRWWFVSEGGGIGDIPVSGFQFMRALVEDGHAVLSNPLEFLVLMGGTIEQAAATISR